MKRPSLALLLLFFLCAIAQGQSVARVSPSVEPASSQQAEAKRAILLLKQLDDDVIVYRSLGEFEESGKLARVPFETFRTNLQNATAEIEPILLRLPGSRLKTEIRNALDSYRDGALFWWQGIDQARVVDVSILTFNQYRRPADTHLRGTVPYTVAIHWRQAKKHLQRAVRQAASLSRE